MKGLAFALLLCAIPLGHAFGDDPGKVIFSRDSGDEFFYEVKPGAIAKGDRLIFSGKGVVKGFVAPFRSSAQKECGAWTVARDSKPGEVIFEAGESAAVEQAVDGFILVGRMGASRNKDGSAGVVHYTYETKEGPLQGELAGPASR